jgi:hypothetical protein
MIKYRQRLTAFTFHDFTKKNVLKGPKEWGTNFAWVWGGGGGGGGATGGPNKSDKKTLIKTIWENIILDIPAVI